MDIKYSDVLTLSDNRKYVVVGIANYNNYNYLYLIDLLYDKNTKFFWLKEESVVELDKKLDSKLINTIIPLFVDSTKEFLSTVIDE